MKAYAILIHQSNNMALLANKRTADLIKKYKHAAVWQGYNQTKYVACLVSKTKRNRDILAGELAKLGITYDTRDDAIVPDNSF